MRPHSDPGRRKPGLARFMTETIAITGATGFAGGHLVAELVARGQRVRALVRKPGSVALPAGVETVVGSLSDHEALKALFKGADAAVHLAGAIAATTREGYFTVNADGTRAVISAAHAAALRRLIHVSSLAAREPHLSAYAASKRAGEDLILAEMPALNAMIIRPPAVYGPGDRGTLPLIRALSGPIAAIPGRSDSRFSLIHGRDLARLIANAIAAGQQGLHEVSDGRAGGYGWADLAAVAAALRGGPVRTVFLPRPVAEAVAHGAEAVARLTGKPSLVNRGKIAELYHPDWVSRDDVLRLADPVSLAAGLAEAVTWYRSAGWLPPGRRIDRRSSNSGTPT